VLHTDDPFIIVGVVFEEDTNKFKNAGCDVVMEKPLRMSTLQTHLQLLGIDM
jgi:hypothetical protein